MIAKKLEGNHVEQALQTVDGFWHSDRLGGRWDRVIIIIADDDWLCLSGGNLCECRLHLFVIEIKGSTCEMDAINEPWGKGSHGS